MKATLLKFWDATRSSYWFIPSLMAVGAIALSFATTAADAIIGAKWLDGVSWLYANKPDGARALLSTIAGSMIGVAGVTFSITIASVSYATTQFGPRLLTNFMRDQGNQITLGTFIATFIYCLLVLRTIRSPDEAPVGAEPTADLAAGFVPHIAILFGLLLTLASIGVFIFFIHHIPESIHASNVVAGVGQELNEQIDTLFPEEIGFAAPDEEDYDVQDDLPAGFLENAAAIRAGGIGYIQFVDEGGLLEIATTHELVLRVGFRPGDFVSKGKTLVRAWPADRAGEAVARQIRNTFAWGRQRTQKQDVLFLANELIEIAARALSPGTNDPFTAITCMDWLGSALSNLARREMPGAYRYDEARRLRIVAHPVSFRSFVEATLPALRPYAQADRNAALHFVKMIAGVSEDAAKNPEARRVLLRELAALKEGATEALTHAQDLDLLNHRYGVAARLLRDGEDRKAVTDREAWLDGSG